VYGPRQSFDLDCAYGGVISIFLNRLLRGMSPVVYGDGEQTRDFVYVRDIVEANMLALNSKKAAGEAINVGSGTRVSVNRVAEVLKSLLNKTSVKNMYVDPRVGDVLHGCAAITKAGEILGYSPKVSFKGGLAELVKWCTENGPPFGLEEPRKRAH
jgi:UDP-glucose 4-epimerase